ncbi:right-handed parallel beta-helix repeat-containing protein [Sunxiuqinia elliptica]
MNKKFNFTSYLLKTIIMHFPIQLLTRFSILLVILVSCHNQGVTQTKQHFFISTTGNNQNPGTLQAPFASIEHALKTIEQQRETGTIIPSSIYIRQGTYPIKETLEIGNHLSQLTIAAYKNESVFFSGGIHIPVEAISSASSPNSEYKQCTIDLKKVGINDYGKIRNVGFARPYGPAWGELFVNKKPMHLSRWPNQGMIPMGKVIEKGSVPRQNDFENKGGIIEYDSLRINQWKDEEDAWMAGYFMWGYADDMVKIAAIDTINRNLKTATATLYGYGDSKAWRNWYGVNILRELDTPGEYYIDRGKGILSFIPHEDVKQLEFSMLETPIIQLSHAQNVHIKNITFECSRGIGIAMDNTRQVVIERCVFRNLGSLGITVGKGIEPFADYLHEGTGNPKSGIVGSLQQHIYANTTFNREGGHNNSIIACVFYQLGAGGVSLGGGDRLTLEPGNNLVENCLFHDINRIEKSYRPAVHLTGVGNQIRHCEMFNTPSMAIYMYGNNHLVEYNYIHDVCLEVEDQGAFYYGRDPSERGTILRYNYFKNIPDHFNTCAVYHDDGACGLTVFGNVFYKAGKWNILLGGGSDNIFQNNLFIANPIGLHVDNRLQNWSKSLLDENGLYEKRLKAVNYTNPPYNTQYPELVTYFDNPSLPQRNLFENNVFIQIDQILDGKKQWLNCMETNWTAYEPLGTENIDEQITPTISQETIINKLPNFKPIPLPEIGIQVELPK